MQRKQFNNLTSPQKKIILNLLRQIHNCEGKDMPRKYWCDSCKTTWKRLEELSLRFISINADNKRAREPTNNMNNLYDYIGDEHFNYHYCKNKNN